MYSELFDQLGASGRLANRGDNRNSNADNEPAPLVSFKAGKMELTPPAAAAASSNKSFQCTPNKTRGEVRLVWKNRALQWQWYDRRDRKVVDTWKVQDYAPNSTFERIVFTPEQEKAHAADRIYVWTRFPKEQQQQQQTTAAAEEESKEQDATATAAATPEYQMFWMQDASDEKDDELVAQVNQYLTDPQSAAPEDEADRMDTTETTVGSGAAAAAATAAGGRTAATNQSQVDALSSILENLGMPQAGSSDTGSDTAAAAAATGGGGGAATGTLTLADLQGAMAGIQSTTTAQQQQQPGPPLSSIITPDAITSLLQDEGARTRLMELLPEEQRTADHLEENLRSPQVQQTLRSLTATLLPDSAGDLSGLYSAMANFQLEPADGQEALAAGNPIQAFLDALLKKVEREQQQQQEEEEKQGEGKNDDIDEDL